MNFIDGLIECGALLIDGDLNQVKVVITRLIVRGSINDNLTVFINGNRRRRLASVCVECAVLC